MITLSSTRASGPEKRVTKSPSSSSSRTAGRAWVGEAVVREWAPGARRVQPLFRRNALNSDLIPILRAAFEDLTEDTQAQALQYCYVYSSQLQATADDVILTIRDLPPSYLKGAPPRPRATRRCNHPRALAAWVP